MKRTLAILAMFAAWGICACAASPQATLSPGESDPGDRELQRGIYWYHQGCTRKALDHLRAAHELYSLADRQAGVARSLIGLANLYRQTDNPENALLFYDAAASAARRCDEQTTVAQALSNKAAVLIEAGDLSLAETLLNEAQLACRKPGSATAMILNYRAVLSMKARRYDEAWAFLDKAESSGAETPSTVAATIRFTRGKIRMWTGDYEQALDLFQQALERDRRMGFARGMADDLLAMADVHERMGHNEDALDCLERGLKIHALMGRRQIVMDNLDRLASLAEQTGSDARVSVHYINQWLAGERVDVICR